MKLSMKLALACTAVAIAVPVSAQAPAAATAPVKTLKVSPKAAKAIGDYQKAVIANNVAAQPALLQAALAAASSPDDKLVIGSNQARAARASGDLAALRAGIDLMASSGSPNVPDVSSLYAELGSRYLKAGNNAEAEAMLSKSAAIGKPNPTGLLMLAQLKDKRGDKAGAVIALQQSFAGLRAEGKVPAKENLQAAAGIAFKANSMAALDFARQWVAIDPTPGAWRDALYIYRQLTKATGTQLVDSLRLAQLTGGLKGEGDYYTYASALAAAGALNEVKPVLATAAKIPVNMTGTQFSTIVKASAAAPARAAVDTRAKAALAGGSQAELIAAGDQLYGLGAYAEAAPLYRAAVAKGGNTSLANLHLGMTLARSGDKAGAEAALKLATGADAEVAKFWLAHTSTMR